MTIDDLWYSEGAVAGAARAALAPLSLVFGAGVRARNFAYQSGLFASRRAPRPVISVGALSVGGAGKTPFVLWLAARLSAAGIRPCIVTGGYGSVEASSGSLLLQSRDFTEAWAIGRIAERAGEEAALLALRSGVPVVAGRDRLAACELAERELGARGEAPDVFVLDDGFQHRALARDLDIVLVGGLESAQDLMPAGPLRERPASLARAHIVVATGGAGLPALAGQLVVRAESRPVAVVESAADPDGEPPATLTGRRVALVAAIARPERFVASVEGIGAKVVATVLRGDHHRYGIDDAREIAAAATDADFVVTTEKDLVKLAAVAIERPLGKPLVALRIDFDVAGEASVVERALSVATLDRRALRQHDPASLQGESRQ